MWADLWSRLVKLERADREGERPREQAQESGGSEGRPPLQPFRQPAIPPEMEREMQERAWRQNRGEAARLAERDREVAARERRAREEERAVARGAHRVIPDPEGGSSPMDVEGRLPCGKRARGEGGEAGQARGKRAPDWGAGSRRSSGGVAARQPQPGADVDGLGLGVATAAAVCAAAGAEGARERGPEMEEGRWRRILGEALPGMSLDCPRERREKAQGADAEGAVAEAGVVRRRGVGQGRRRTEVLIFVIMWATGCRARRTEGTGRAEGRGLQAAGGVGSGGGHGKEMVVDRRRGSMEQETSEGTQSVKRWQGHCQQRRMASVAGGDEGMKVGDMDLPREDLDPRQQRLGRWDRGAPTDVDVAAEQKGTGGASQCEAPDEWSGTGEDGVCAGDQSGRGVL